MITFRGSLWSAAACRRFSSGQTCCCEIGVADYCGRCLEEKREQDSRTPKRVLAHARGIARRLLRRRRKIDEALFRSFASVAVSYGYDRTQSFFMNYFKSVLVGLVAVLVICVFVPALPTLVHVFVFVIKHGADGIGIAGGRVSWRAPSLAEWLFMFAVFGAGFLWELRRLARRQLPSATDPADPPIS